MCHLGVNIFKILWLFQSLGYILMVSFFSQLVLLTAPGAVKHFEPPPIIGTLCLKMAQNNLIKCYSEAQDPHVTFSPN